MLFMLSPGMLNSIEQSVHNAVHGTGILDIHKIAEEIRLEHVRENVALEDIIERLDFFAGSTSIKFDRTAVDTEKIFPASGETRILS